MLTEEKIRKAYEALLAKNVEFPFRVSLYTEGKDYTLEFNSDGSYIRINEQSSDNQ